MQTLVKTKIVIRVSFWTYNHLHFGLFSFWHFLSD